MGILRLELGNGPLRAEHERLLRTALRRGTKDPEGELGGELEGTYSEVALTIARETWLQRMLHEHHSAAVFSRLLPQLMAAEATLDIKTAVLRMAMDELRHAGLCAGVVELLGGTPEIDAELETEPLPEHPDAPPLERALRNVMFVGCLSETISIALLTEERELTTEPAIHRVVDQLAADEVLHAKLGWSYLAEVWPRLDVEGRARVNAYLPVAFGHLEKKMLAAMPPGPELGRAQTAELHALGTLESKDGRELFYSVVETVVAPRLDAQGLAGSAAWESRR